MLIFAYSVIICVLSVAGIHQQPKSNMPDARKIPMGSMPSGVLYGNFAGANRPTESHVREFHRR